LRSRPGWQMREHNYEFCVALFCRYHSGRRPTHHNRDVNVAGLCRRHAGIYRSSTCAASPPCAANAAIPAAMLLLPCTLLLLPCASLIRERCLLSGSTASALCLFVPASYRLAGDISCFFQQPVSGRTDGAILISQRGFSSQAWFGRSPSGVDDCAFDHACTTFMHSREDAIQHSFVIFIWWYVRLFNSSAARCAAVQFIACLSSSFLWLGGCRVEAGGSGQRGT